MEGCPIVAPHDLCEAVIAWRARWNRSTTFAPAASVTLAKPYMHSTSSVLSSRQAGLHAAAPVQHLAGLHRLPGRICRMLTPHIQKIWLATSPSVL